MTELSRALYDRQIRLWGVGTQLRLSSAKILIINLGSVGMEVVKNLVLGGINTIDILDPSTVKLEDFGSQFFLPNDDSIVGQLKLPLVVEGIKELNSRVNVNIFTETFSDWDSEKFKHYDLIIGTELNKPEIINLNTISRSFNIPLYIAGLHGMFGYIFTDLIEHFSTVEKGKGNYPTAANTPLGVNKIITEVITKDDNEIITIKDTYTPISDIFNSQKLPGQLNRRRLKRLTPALPIILTLLDLPREEVDPRTLELKSQQMCGELGVPKEIITKQYIEDFSRQMFTEFAPTSAILGGCLGQDIIQYLSRKNSPINNVLILDGTKSEMPIFGL